MDILLTILGLIGTVLGSLLIFYGLNILFKYNNGDLKKLDEMTHNKGVFSVVFGNCNYVYPDFQSLGMAIELESGEIVTETKPTCKFLMDVK